MHNKMITAIALLLLVELLFPADQEAHSGTSVLPVIMHSPETGWGFGAYLIHYDRAYELNREGIADPMNFYSAVGVYTLKNQIQFNASAEHYLSPTLQAMLELTIKKYPNQFCGIGNKTRVTQEEDYTDNYGEYEMGVFSNIVGNLSLGPNYRLLYSKPTDFDRNGSLHAGELPGSETYLTHGIGIKTIYDLRDAVIYPTTGYFIQLATMHYDEAWGSDFTYTRYSFDARAYYTIVPKHILALQYVYLFSDGEPPFQEMAELCDYDTMRGFYEGRYRDHNAMMMQAEYRFPLFHRIGGTVFGGVGDVSSTLDKFTTADLKVAGGVGFRYAWDTKENLNIRLDITVNNSSDRFDDDDHSEMKTSFYFNVKEAF